MPAKAPRQQLHGYISTEARAGWYRFAEQHDTNVSALLEAVGLLLAEHVDKPPTLLQRIIRDARLIASSRSSRRGSP